MSMESMEGHVAGANPLNCASRQNQEGQIFDVGIEKEDFGIKTKHTTDV